MDIKELMKIFPSNFPEPNIWWGDDEDEFEVEWPGISIFIKLWNGYAVGRVHDPEKDIYLRYNLYEKHELKILIDIIDDALIYKCSRPLDMSR
jgi:hypothetical protein